MRAHDTADGVAPPPAATSRSSQDAGSDERGPEIIRHNGFIAPDVVVEFAYDPTTGKIAATVSGDPRLHARNEILRRYRALRHQFLERVAAVVGGRVAVIELDEGGSSDGVHIIDEPKAGHA